MKQNSCAECGQRRAIFSTTKNKRCRAARDHNLCKRCWRASNDRRHAVILIVGTAVHAV